MSALSEIWNHLLLLPDGHVVPWGIYMLAGFLLAATATLAHSMWSKYRRR